jgi:hypothetical protein
MELITERSKSIGFGVTRDRRVVATRDRGSGTHGVGGSWWITEESVLNFPSAFSIPTTVAQICDTCKVAVY